jgi:hypothetical protein
MYAGAGGRNQFGSPWLELHVVDRLLGQLTRPALVDTSLPETVCDQLNRLGLQSGPSSRRDELVAQLWGRKRPLLQELYDRDDPIPPCA